MKDSASDWRSPPPADYFLLRSFGLLHGEIGEGGQVAGQAGIGSCRRRALFTASNGTETLLRRLRIACDGLGNDAAVVNSP
jgi:hypothetical protein